MDRTEGSCPFLLREDACPAILPVRLMLQSLLIALLGPALLLIGLTYLVSTGRLRFSSAALSLLSKRQEIWRVGIIALVAAGAIKALLG